MNSSLIVVLALSLCVALSSALSCHQLEQSAGKYDMCYIEEKSDLDKELIGSMSKCSEKDVNPGTPSSVTNASFCYIAVFRANSTGTMLNKTMSHQLVIVQRGAGIGGNCSTQCTALEAAHDIGNAAPMTRTLLYFECNTEANSNGQNAADFKGRTEKFKCSDFKMKPAQSAGISVWLIVGVALAVALVVALIIVGVVVMCVRKRKSRTERGHAEYTTAATAE